MKLHKGDVFLLAESPELIRDLVKSVKDPANNQRVIELNLVTDHGESLSPLIFRLGAEVASSELMVVDLEEEYYGDTARVVAPLRPPFSQMAGPILFVPDEA